MKFHSLVSKTTAVVIFACLSVVTTIAYADSDQIQLRINKQNKDIKKGITLGQLTQSEREILKSEHTHIAATYKKMLNDKKIDSTEKALIFKMLNKSSLKIFDLRYNKDRKK